MADKVWSATASTDAAAAGNYAGGLPVTGSNLILNNIGSSDLAVGLGYYTNVLGLTFNVYDAFTSKVGVEASGTNNATYLAVGTSGASVLYIGRSAGGIANNGSPLMLIDGSTGTMTANVYKTGSKSGAYPCLCLKGTGVAVNAFGGETGFAIRPTETGTLTALRMLKDTNYSPPVVRCGAGTTFPSTVPIERGTLYSNSTHAITTLKLSGPEAVAQTEADSTGAITNVDLSEGGKLIHKGTGAVTAVTARATCILDYTQDGQSKTLDAVVAHPGSSILLDNGIVGSITHSAGGTNVPIIFCPGGIGTVTITAPAGMALSIQ